MKPNQELLQTAELVAREKDIDREEILLVMEEAMAKVAAEKYGAECPVKVTIDRHNGAAHVFRLAKAVEEIQDPKSEITMEQAKTLNPFVKPGDEVSEPLPMIEFGRTAAQAMRQTIVQRIREIERERQYEEFKNRLGEMVNVVVKRIEFGNVIVDIGRTESILRREEQIPREHFRVNDRIRAVISELRPEGLGPMVILSRTHPQFLAKLFQQEVPEIYDGVIEIRAVARDPGSRSKMAVYTSDSNLDPVGACVGVRGARVQAVVNELQGEKIDIIPWSGNPATFVVNALAPAEVLKVVLEDASQDSGSLPMVEVVVAEDQLSLAIGRKGQNVRLASHLTNMRIEIVTEGSEATRRAGEGATRVKLFMDALDVDEMLAQWLVAEGFGDVNEVAALDVQDSAETEGVDGELILELKTRAQNYLAGETERVRVICLEKGMEQSILELPHLTPAMWQEFLRQRISKLDDLAELATDELLEILQEYRLSPDEANEVIMAARAHWFTEEGK